MSLETLLKDIYFDELNARDKIFTRLQLNFAAYVTTITIIAYMARMIDYSSPHLLIVLFYSGLLLSIAPLTISIRYTITAFTGHTYVLFPSATLSVKYKAEVDNYFNASRNQNLPNKEEPDDIIENYVLESLAQCIDKNKEINEYRRLANRKAMLQLFYTALPLLASASLFVLFDLDTSSPRKNFLTEDRGMRESVAKSGVEISEAVRSLTKELLKMSEKKEPQENQQKPQPPQPTLPKRPPLQYSTEDFKAPLPDKSKTLNEGK